MRLLLYTSLLLLGATPSLAQDSESPCTRFVLKTPAGITQPGDRIEFNVEGQPGSGSGTLTYEWKIEAFQVRGQGTSRIEIQTDRRVGNIVIPVSVKVTDHKNGCITLLSETASIGPAGPGPDHFWTEIDTRTKSALKGQLDVFFAELANNPTHEGVIELTFLKNERQDRKKSRLRLISKHIAYRHFDFSRISYYITSGEYERIRVVRMPPGADYDFLKIDQQKLIKAEEYKAK